MSKKSLFLMVLGALCFAGCSDDASNGGGSGGDAAVCGNGNIEASEVCDDGNTNDNDGCKADCSSVQDGYTCPTPGEACHKKTNPDPHVDPECGNGKVENGEACDDSNTADGDGCAADCKSVESGYTCPKTGGACTLQSEPGCGNGAIDEGEACDDGNTDSGDGCSADCSAIEEGYTCPTPGEDCISEGCGNGNVDEGEECDAGEDFAPYGRDACTESCKTAHYCGDGKLDAIDIAHDEECDAGQDTSSEYGGCTTDCHIVNFCGDGIVQSDHEKCDDGNIYNEDGCSADCQTVEEGYACVTSEGKSICHSLLCGNGKLDGAETCDDGNQKPGDGCSQS